MELSLRDPWAVKGVSGVATIEAVDRAPIHKVPSTGSTYEAVTSIRYSPCSVGRHTWSEAK